MLSVAAGSRVAALRRLGLPHGATEWTTRRGGAGGELVVGRRLLKYAAQCVAVFCSVGLAAGQELPAPVERVVDFEADIRPLLSRCLGCHGPGQQINGLRLDSRAELLKGGYSGAAIQVHRSGDSKLVHMVAGFETKVIMPPGGPTMSAEEVGLIRAWIDQGAPWAEDDASANVAGEAPVRSEHWAFQPRSQPEPPDVEQTGWVANPVDAFVLARLEADGINPSGEAARETLARRVALDVTGLPPEPAELRVFLADREEGAYGRYVERMLRSPHYGEKWASHWLDQVRYADSDGYEKDDPRPFAWRYREWVINALNANMAFDQFTVEQIAGDLLPNATVEQRVATGMHRNTLKNREGGVFFEQFRFEETVDRANTVGTVWLGLTLGCAQCHDHKYDPVSQKDYYSFYAFFNDIEEDLIPAPMAGEMGPYLRTHDEYLEERQALLDEHAVAEFQRPWEKKVQWHGANPGQDTAWDVNFDTLQKMTDGGDRFIKIPESERTERQKEVVTDYFLRFYGQVVSSNRMKELKFAKLRRKLADLKKDYPQLTMARVVKDRQVRRQTHVHVRGGWDRAGIPVKAEPPAVLPEMRGAEGEQATRLDLARWIVSDENPLTARVLVNRVWEQYFGTGLVATTDDFGIQGEEPSHPALLDWLAEDFVRSGWDLKHLHRRIVTSATYRQASDARPELTEMDPANRLLARQARLRMRAETIRDGALAAAGLLAREVGGPSVYPPQPEGVADLSYAGGFDWPESTGADAYRRGLYVHFQRTVPYPMLMNFDGAERTVAECTRERSNTPLQALNLLNDPVFFEAAQGLAMRVLTESPASSFRERLGYAYEVALARKPSARERDRLAGLFAQQKSVMGGDAELAAKWFPAGLEGVERAEAAAWVGVSRVVLNLDEFITRE